MSLCSFCWRLVGRKGVQSICPTPCDCGCHSARLVTKEFNKRRGGKP